MPTVSDKQVNNLGAACFRCRGFRHACDRKTPSCSRCYKRGIACVYPEAAPSLKKLQQTTETLSNRIKKFKIDNATCRRNVRVSLSMSHYSVYPCTKCFKDLQQCDLRHDKCSRCAANNFECEYAKTEPKANNVSQILNTMNKVLDHWQDSINKSKSISFKLEKPKTGLFMTSNVYSCHDFSALMDQLKRVMTPYQSTRNKMIEFDSTGSIISCWKEPTRTIQPHTHNVEITQALTDQLVHQFCRTPCIPILDTSEFINRYQDSSTVLIYAICATTAQSKAISLAYHSRARDLFSECFDKPSLEHCQAAFLLSLGNKQHFYEWIAYTMALELDLYHPQTRHEAMLIWCLYYFSGKYKPSSVDTVPQLASDIVWNSWVYLIQLQILRDQTIASHHSPESLMALQKSLFEFQENLLPEWQLNGHFAVTPQQLDSPISFSSTSCSSCSSLEPQRQDKEIQLVRLHYLVNQILLYEPFVPRNQVPNTAFSKQSLQIIITAANQLSDICESIKQVPYVAIVCTNAVYNKIMSFQHDQYSFIGRLGLLRSLDVCKNDSYLDTLLL